MKKQIFYIHGGDAFSEYSDFLAYLKKIPIRDLPGADEKVMWGSNLTESLGSEYEVFAPQMPNKLNAKYDEWRIWFERHFEHINDGVVLVGWSLGAYFLLKFLTENKMPCSVASLFLISPLYENNPSDPDGEDGGDFSFDNGKLGQILEQTKNIHIYHSKDDFVVPYEHAQKLAVALPKATLHTFDDRNHFLQEEFPELIEEIRKVE